MKHILVIVFLFISHTLCKNSMDDVVAFYKCTQSHDHSVASKKICQKNDLIAVGSMRFSGPYDPGMCQKQENGTSKMYQCRKRGQDNTIELDSWDNGDCSGPGKQSGSPEVVNICRTWLDNPDFGTVNYQSWCSFFGIPRGWPHLTFYNDSTAGNCKGKDVYNLYFHPNRCIHIEVSGYYYIFKVANRELTIEEYSDVKCRDFLDSVVVELGRCKNNFSKDDNDNGRRFGGDTGLFGGKDFVFDDVSSYENWLITSIIVGGVIAAILLAVAVIFVIAVVCCVVWCGKKKGANAYKLLDKQKALIK